MPEVGKITVTLVGNDRVYTDESGQSFTIKGRSSNVPLDIDPRIDLTKPIYDQVMKLMAKDRATEARAKKRKSAVEAA